MSAVDIHPISKDTVQSSRPARRAWFSNPTRRWLILLLLLAAAVIIQENSSPDSRLDGRFETFVTIFLSIFIEAVPFLLAGSIVSGLIEVWVDQDTLYRFIPRQRLLGALVGGGLGIVFPVCECGVVPVTRRLYQKGLPLSIGIAFLLAAPVVNPVTIASTYAAFGWGPLLWARVGLSFLIASLVGLIFSFAKPAEVLLPEVLSTKVACDRHDHAHHHDHRHDPEDLQNSPGRKVWQALHIAGDDFLDMARYLVAGSMLAALMQTLVPQSALLAVGSGALTSVLVMMVLAFVLSVCSTVDAFLALAFVNTFPGAAILAFLVFGPMVDIKSSLMFLGVFQRRVVLYLILLPLMLMLTVAVYLNLNVRW